MKTLLKMFRNFFIIFAVFVVLAIILKKSERAREFVTPGREAMPPPLDLPDAVNNE